jgi:CDP-glycerol glycerophosphotransferase (TagB/SpsB family)
LIPWKSGNWQKSSWPMNTPDKKRILLLITNIYAATNVIHSGLIKPLAEQYEVHIMSNIIGQKETDEINRHFSVRVQRIDIPIVDESNLLRFLRQLEKALFFNLFDIETQRIKEKGKGFWYNAVVGTSLFLMHFFRLSRTLLQFIRKTIIKLTRQHFISDELAKYHFSGVISSSPLDIRENTIVNFLKTKGVLSLAMVISWDNLTSKGIMNADHDYVLVWNKFMENEYQRFYSVFNTSKPQICITGVPRFDIYFRDLPDPYSISGFRKRYKIRPSDHIIFFATSAVSHFPNQACIVQDLLAYALLRSNIKILVRCHTGDVYDNYAAFKKVDNIVIWHPQEKQGSGLMPDLDILYSLAEMLKYCHVCVNVASTIRLEAAICNKPGISIAYDGNAEPEFHRSVKRFYAYSHQIPLNKLKIDSMAHSKEELFLLLDKILLKPCVSDTDLSGKIREFTYHNGPFAVTATLKYIQQWLN